MSICVCAQISMRVRESRGVKDKPSPAVRSISKPRSRGIPHYITPPPRETRDNPAGWEPVQASNTHIENVLFCTDCCGESISKVAK